MEQILIIDDDVDMCLMLEKLLARKGYHVIQVYSGEKALEFLEFNQPDLVICDLRLEDIDGISLLKKVKQKYAALPFIIITAYDDIQLSVEAMDQGAYEYVTKPILAEEILVIIQNALKKNPGNYNFAGLGNSFPDLKHFFGNTEYFKKINTQINLVAPTDYNVVLYGETGSGKKVLAYEIHKRSRRSNMPFIIVTNEELCSQRKEDHSGMTAEDRLSFFETANGGTILLHNISGLPNDMQDALLSCIRNRKIKRAHASNEVELDIRFVISSNDLLWNAMRAGGVQENLFYWLNDFSIELLPLRSRRDDVLLFANHFLCRANKEQGKKVMGFTAEVENILNNYGWPGNLRELKNVINKALLLTKGDMVKVDSLPEELHKFRSCNGASF